MLYLSLLETGATNSFKMENDPPISCINSSESQSSCCFFVGSDKAKFFSTQKRELVSILVDLENIDNKSDANAIGQSRIFRKFCIDTVFNLSQNVLMDNRVKVSEEDLDYTPTQSKITELEPRKDFEEFCNGMFAMILSLSSMRQPHLHPSVRINHR